MDHDYELASYDRTTNHVFDKEKLSKENRYWKNIAPTRAAEEADIRGGWEHKNFKKSWNTTKAQAQAAQTVEQDSKRDEVRARKAAAEAPPSAADGPIIVGQPGKAPWEESEETREQRRLAALQRKAIRAAKRGEG
jgi:hypothetical protein